MALQKVKELDSGFSANYYKITSFDITRNSDGSASLEVCASLFKDAASRTAGKAPVDYTRSSFDVTSQESIGNLIELGYTKLKTLDAFSGATDV